MPRSEGREHVCTGRGHRVHTQERGYVYIEERRNMHRGQGIICRGDLCTLRRRAMSTHRRGRGPSVDGGRGSPVGTNLLPGSQLLSLLSVEPLHMT